MYVTDLRHFLDLSPSAPGPARRLAEHLGGIVRTAAAGDAGISWISALPCRRRPARRPCPGRITVFRPEPPAGIRWECGVCRDQGVISGWQSSPYDLRRRGSSLTGSLHQVVLSHDTAAALRELRLLDADCERLVYRILTDGDVAVLAATDEDLDELAGSVAAEGNHEPNRRVNCVSRLDRRWRIRGGVANPVVFASVQSLSLVLSEGGGTVGPEGRMGGHDERSGDMRDAQACAICGGAVLNMDLHARFHEAIDTMDRTLSDSATEASDALEKADHVSNILYQRGID